MSSEPENCPDRSIWRDWLKQDDGDIQVAKAGLQVDLLEHLDHCNACQMTLDEIARIDPFFVQSRDALRATGLTSRDLDARPSELGEPTTSAGQPSTALTAIVESLLGPTDDPRSMGRLGRFEVHGIVGSGGMGIVLKARSIDMDRIVAIKIPQPTYWQSRDTLLTLEREARSAAAVVHPGVISIYHVDRYRDVPYLVMPFLSGPTLQQRLRSNGAMSITDALQVTRQVASALAAAHSCGVIHRDVKPANILLGQGTQRAILSDFGLAKIQSDATCTATGTFAGTPIYLSPEQASGDRAGPAGDVFSLGTVLWTMLSGCPPLSGMHTHAIVRSIADGNLPPIDDHAADVPPWLQRLMQRLHAIDPADRPSAIQVAQWTEQCLRHRADPKSFELPEPLRCDVDSRNKTKRNSRRILLAILVSFPMFASWQCVLDTNSQFKRVDSVDQQQATEPRIGPLETDATSIPAANSNHKPAPSKTAAAPSATKRELDRLNADMVESIAEDLQTIQSREIPRWQADIETLLRSHAGSKSMAGSTMTEGE